MYDRYVKYKSIKIHQNDNTSFIVLMKGNKKPLKVDLILDISLTTLTGRTYCIINDKQHMVISLIPLDGIETFNVYDEKQHQINNLNNIIFLNEMYNRSPDDLENRNTG